jgi:peptidoglycan hydrolase-like protein with peptidoglycan-binding domain
MKTRIATVGLGLALALGVAAPASAQSIAELQAQINALMAQLAALQGGSTVTTSTTFTQDLTVGSTGSQVTALQQMLVAQRHLVMPVGVAYGYFGSLTQAAVAKWQAANGVSPAAGYWGPISRAKHASMGGSTGTVPGTTVGGGTTTGGSITTPGVEGSVTVSVNPSPSTGTKLYEGDSMRQVMGIKLEAKTSDIRIERIKVDLDCVTCTPGSDNDLYRKIANKIYVMDGSTVVGSVALNSSTVVEDGSDRFITISGLNVIVPKDATKVLYLALDAQGTWDSTYNGDAWTLGIPTDGVRGIDGAGINQYGPTTAFTREFNSADELLASASLAISLNTSSPNTNQVICEGSTDNDECDELELLQANFKAEKDAVTVTDLVASITRSNDDSANATATTAYLYDGSTLVGSASVAGTSATAMSATFSDIDWTVPADTTKVLTVKLDIRDAALTTQTFSVAISSGANVTAENSVGDSVTETGSATSKTLTIRKVGPEITLVSKSITTNGVPQTVSGTDRSTSTLVATFNLKIKAVGGDLTFGTVASGTPLIATSTTGLATKSFAVYRGGTELTTISSFATSTAYNIPSTCATGSLTNSCVLSEGAEVSFPVTFQILGRDTSDAGLASGLYAVQLSNINWWNDSTGSVQTTNFMDGLADWRTADVSFP